MTTHLPYTSSNPIFFLYPIKKKGKGREDNLHAIISCGNVPAKRCSKSCLKMVKLFDLEIGTSRSLYVFSLESGFRMS